MRIRVIPKSKRAKERTRQHGTVMDVVKLGVFRGLPAVLCRSVFRTFKHGSNMTHWEGWFREDEAAWVVVTI
jgi:hypothetical protein